MMLTIVVEYLKWEKGSMYNFVMITMELNRYNEGCGMRALDSEILFG